MFKRWTITALAIFILFLPWQGHLASWCEGEMEMSCCTAPGDCSMEGMSGGETDRDVPEFCECETSRTDIPSALPVQSGASQPIPSPASPIYVSMTWEELTRVSALRPSDQIRDRSGTYLKQHSIRI